MFRHPKVIVLAVGGLVLSTSAWAQNAPTGAGGTNDPASASSPHQRAATSSGTGESQPVGGSDPSAASTPHQRDAMKGASSDTSRTANRAGAISADTFVKQAGEDGMAEVAMAKLAQAQSRNDAVRQFATHMEQDHNKANTELMAVASRKSINAPRQLDAEHQAKITELKAKTGAAFDSAYANEMTAAHTKAVALFQQAANSADPDIAAFASKTLPTLEHHKQLADGLKSKVKTAAVDSGRTSQQ